MAQYAKLCVSLTTAVLLNTACSAGGNAPFSANNAAPSASQYPAANSDYYSYYGNQPQQQQGQPSAPAAYQQYPSYGGTGSSDIENISLYHTYQ